MDTQLLERYGAAVPRYTSYPTAPHFEVRIDAGAYGSWLAALEDSDSLSLYLHVPFCAELCWYCGCHTKVVNQYRPIAAYVDLLAAEIDLVAAAVPGRPRVSHVHWGGGTPTMLSTPDFGRLMRKLRRCFDFAGDSEVAVEIDPRNFTAKKAGALARAGVTRASLGVQDLNPEVQAAIHRIQPYDMTARAVDWLREAGIKTVNFDLMYGLPKQTREGVLHSLDLAVGLAPDRIALFGYAHVPWMKRHQRLIDEADLPGPAARFAQAEAAAERLVQKGYRRIGLDHFARPEDSLSKAAATGCLHRNFQGYTTDEAANLLGFGASAIGSLAQGYVQNAVPFRDYAERIGRSELAVTKGIELSPDDRCRREIIERIMCDLAVDLSEIAKRHPGVKADFELELKALMPMVRDGLVEIDGRRIAVTEAGRPFLRSACARFDSYLGQGEARHSRAV